MTLFGIFYFLVCAVCGGMIFISVYGRFLHLYVMAACAPLALFLAVGMKLQSIDWLELDGVGGWFDGMTQCLQNMVTMILMAASVKSADSFMRRIFGL